MKNSLFIITLPYSTAASSLPHPSLSSQWLLLLGLSFVKQKVDYCGAPGSDS